ncbi:Ribonuclease Y [Geodia barretti]|uniref:Ribonuclease Y n=1 Tax=Geodia barretti TaxID=519541 RepID=A0AA35SWM1_GEOBA|nr:Ribonuclease Y [Geodia barretti]
MEFVWFFILPLAGLLIGWLVRWSYARFELSSSEQKAKRVLQDAIREAEEKKREALIETKDLLLAERETLDRESRDQRREIERYERKIRQREESLQERLESVSRQERALATREQQVQEREDAVGEAGAALNAELEKVAQLTVAEAKRQLTANIETDARRDAHDLVRRIEAEAAEGAERQSRAVIVTAMQRLATEVTAETTVTSVDLPSDEMKGRIIGREGRNIRALETLTGVDIIIDDTPEAVILSCFDPVRRETAKQALQRLVADGRIHPARIEEVVRKVMRELEQTLFEEGQRVLFELGIHDMHPDGVAALGRLRYRTSYGQNQLSHSKEAAVLAGFIAVEVGADTKSAKRATLLHDVGKGMVSDGEVGHAELGMDLASGSTVEAIIVQIADTISSSRPGARREALDNYLKRLEDLERIAGGYDGVEKTYAIQAGRELRILVSADTVSDQRAGELGPVRLSQENGSSEATW